MQNGEKKKRFLSDCPECEQWFRIYFSTATSNKSPQKSSQGPQKICDYCLEVTLSSVNNLKHLKLSFPSSSYIFLSIFILFLLDLIPSNKKNYSFNKHRDVVLRKL